MNVLILLAVLWPRHGAGLFRATRPGLVVLRGLSLAGASVFLGFALRLMPVGETLAVVYLYP